MQFYTDDNDNGVNEHKTIVMKIIHQFMQMPKS